MTHLGATSPDRMKAGLGQGDTPTGFADPPKMVVHIQGLEKTYHRGEELAIRVLKGIELQIPRGQYVAIMGPSGSGKSTLMNILGCLDRPTAGRYLLESRDVARMGDNELSRVRGRYLGFVFQAFNLIPQLTILENVAVPLFYQGIAPEIRKTMATAALEKVQLDHRLDHRPSQLSGGQMQRVAIARALVNQPSLLLADEPTGNLDSATGQAILEMFDELHAQGLTVVMVTHDESIAKRCQRVVRLKDGQIDQDVLN